MNKSKIIKSLYLGGGFRDHQILYMIPIIDGICSKNKIKKVIFEKNFSKKLQNIQFISKFISKYEIEFLQNLISKENKLSKSSNILFLLIFLKSFKISEKYY